MDLEESIDLYSIRTLMNLSRYMLSQKPILKRVLTQLDVQMQELAEEVAAEENIKKFNVYSDKQRAFFFITSIESSYGRQLPQQNGKNS